MASLLTHRPSLTVLMNRHGTDKLHIHGYDPEYIRHFEPLRDKTLRLLEIGIGGYSFDGKGGQSLHVWRDYFLNGHIVGMDIADKSFLDEERITTWRGDQSDPAQLEEINERSGPFDIIIDDGSHIQSHILCSFRTLFPVLNPGGIYVIEDLQTCYVKGYGGDESEKGPLHQRYEMTALNLLSSLIDGIHWRFWRTRGPSDLQRLVKSIHISKELAFIYKH